MVRLEDAVIARLDTQGERFEILVDPDLAMRVKHGETVNVEDLLVIDSIFKDARKGDVKSEERIKAIFKTTNLYELSKKIILEGEVQLTTQQRREIVEQKRKEIIATIAKNAINPQTKAPHPPQRIELAMEEAKIQVDINKPVKDQVQAVLKEIRKLIPISIENFRIAVKIPAEFTGKGNVILHKHKLEKEEWQNDGSLIAVIEIPAGTKQDLFNELNHLTHGTVETKLLESKPQAE